MTHSEKIREAYEDATFNLLMEQWATQQGEQYKTLNEQLKQDPACAVPSEVSQACYRTIRQEISKARQTRVKRAAGKALQRAAILIVALVLLMTGALALSPVLRAHTLNLVLETLDGHANISFFSSEEESAAGIWGTGWLPDGYSCTYQSENDTMWEFENEAGHWIIFIVSPDTVGIDLDTENASVMETVYIGACEGLYVERPKDNSLIWGDAAAGKVLMLHSDDLDKATLLTVAEHVVLN